MFSWGSVYKPSFPLLLEGETTKSILFLPLSGVKNPLKLAGKSFTNGHVVLFAFEELLEPAVKLETNAQMLLLSEEIAIVIA